MENNRLNRNKGITLIALIITIIVLLLLAGISISMLAGNNSILNRGGQSRAANALGAAKDEVSMKIQAATQDYFLSVYNSNTTTSTGNTYSRSQLDADAMAAVTSISTADVSIKQQEGANWNTSDQSIILQYNPDGSTVRGQLENGVMTWGTIENVGQISPKPITEIGAITPASPEIGEGIEITLTAQINSDATESLIWTIEPTTVATITPVGKNSVKVTGITGQAGNTATLTASYGSLPSMSTTISVIETPQEASTTTSYVGYYAEVDGVWGIIYADLLAQNPRSGTCNHLNWNISSKSTNPDDYKSYTVSSKIPTGKTTVPNTGYTTTGVVNQINDTSGLKQNRFYVMETTDHGIYTWDNACALSYGDTGKWRLPNDNEWGLFARGMNIVYDQAWINPKSYEKKGLYAYYWSSRQYNSTHGGIIDFTMMNTNNWSKTSSAKVRLTSEF